MAGGSRGWLWLVAFVLVFIGGPLAWTIYRAACCWTLGP
jgi:hypothetical protein